MVEWVAERTIMYSAKGESKRKELTIQIGRPYLLEEGMVNFKFDEGVAGCTVKFKGLDQFSHEIYGADLLHALELAVQVDKLLLKLTNKYDFLFLSGEPYFDEEST